VLPRGAIGGLMGTVLPDSWLPALPDGSSMGPMPGTLHQRYVDLYQTFGEAWRVTDANSLFDYAPGTSTGTFTMRSWPPEQPPCEVPGTIPVEPASRLVAQDGCRAIAGENMRADCIFDVMVTGDTGFAESYLQTQTVQQEAHVGATVTTLVDQEDPTEFGEPVMFTAAVAPKVDRGGGAPTGAAQLLVNGRAMSGPIALDASGKAIWRTAMLLPGSHEVAARYLPAPETDYLPSISAVENHVILEADDLAILRLILILLLLLFIVWVYRTIQ